MKGPSSGDIAVLKAAAPMRSIVLFVLALAVAAIGALAWKEFDSLQNARNTVHGELQMQTLSLSSVFETSFESAEQTLTGVANRVEYNPGQPDIPLDLRKRLLRSPALSELRFYAADGRLGERTGLAPLPSDTLPAWVQQAVRQGRTTGMGKDGNQLALYRTASTAQGRPMGTVYATLAADYFLGISSQSLVNGITASCLLGPDGGVVMEIGDASTSCRSADATRLLQLLDRQLGSYGSGSQQVDHHIISVQQLRNHPLRVVQIASDALVLQRWKQAGLYSLAATVFIMLAAWLFIRYLQHSEQRSRLARQELLQAQTHLQTSHDLLDRLSQHVPGVIFQFRSYPDGRYTMPYASEGLYALFGVRPQEVQHDAAPVFLRIHREDLQTVVDSIHRSGASQSGWQQEFRVVNGAQPARWMAGMANPLRLEDGSLLWHGFIKDITDRKLLEQAVYEHDRDLNTILENSSVGIIFVKGRIQIWANARMAELFGYGMLDIVGQSTRMYYPSDEAFEAMGRNGYAAIQRGERYIVEQQMRHKQGPMVWMRVSGKAVDSTKLEAGSIWVFEDVSEQKRLETHLKLAASVFTHAKEGILITDAAGLIVDVNDTFCKITGYSREDALGQNPRILNSGRQPADFYAQMWQSLNDKGHWYGEVWNRRKQGDVYAEMLTISSVLDAQGAVQNYVALFSDITPLKQHQQQLEHIAHYDALTNLPNRLLLADRLHQALIQSQRRKLCLAVVFLDLDGFKSVNDSHGHATGDALLIALSQRLQATLREGDTLARIGGDEFVAVLAGLEHPHDCEPILVRLLQAAAEPIRVAELTLRVSASMGVTLYPQDGAEVDLLMRQADQAMYAAKQAGKNRYHLFDVTQDAAIRAQRDRLERLQQGLLQEQFALYYQPKVNMRTGTVVGAEALIRWNHPQLGLLQPVDFLPIIENHPLSIALGEWVIRTALAQMGRWHAAGLALPVSVNISSMQLQDAHFPERLQQLLADCSSVHPGQLELEVLETSAFEDLPRIHAIISRCQGLGVQFALDDFGTGYSSLAYLKHLPVETLKIDRSFVRDMLEDVNDLAIVNGVIGLARAFGRQVVAEGVETLAHRDLLIAIGCEVAQGYGIAMPMVASRFPDWVTQWQADPQGSYLRNQPPPVPQPLPA